MKLGYLTPEQAAGAQPGPASDLFVLGQLLTYAATGTTPLADADAIAHGEPDLGPVADGLRPVVARCLAKSPEDRPRPGRSRRISPWKAQPPSPATAGSPTP
ncbi:hypothetical protein ACFQ60_32035 [Streptomyces zhihengii]